LSPGSCFSATDKRSDFLDDALADIPQTTSEQVEIVPIWRPRGQLNFPAAIRWPDFGDLAVFGSTFGQFSPHPDTPIPDELRAITRKKKAGPDRAPASAEPVA
jgi:hypothetical protein